MEGDAVSPGLVDVLDHLVWRSSRFCAGRQLAGHSRARSSFGPTELAGRDNERRAARSVGTDGRPECTSGGQGEYRVAPGSNFSQSGTKKRSAEAQSCRSPACHQSLVASPAVFTGPLAAALEILDRSFVLLRRRARCERAEVAPLARLGIELARVQPVLARA